MTSPPSGIDLTSIMHSGGWNDPKMPRYYTRELAAQESGMARMLKVAAAIQEGHEELTFSPRQHPVAWVLMVDISETRQPRRAKTPASLYFSRLTN